MPNSPQLPPSKASLPDPFDELFAALQAGDLIICVGPLLPAAAGFPNIDEVAGDMIKVAVDRDDDLDADGLKALVEAGEAVRALDILKASLGDVPFTRHVSDHLDDPAGDIPLLARHIAGLRHGLRAVYTTNFDRIIERAFEHLWPSFSRPQWVLTQRRRIVFKLRGDLQAPGSWVLTKTQEESEFASPLSRRRKLFDVAYSAHCMVFVAFDVKCKLLSTLLSLPTPPEPGEPKPSHFIVVDGEISALDHRELMNRGLTVLPGSAERVLRQLVKRAYPHEYLDHTDKLDPADTNTASPRLPDECPYPGLEPFSYELREFFFGRYAEASEATALLGRVDPSQPSNRWLAVEGPSGVGKSSFVNAGIRKALERGFAPGTPTRWKVASMRPGRRPLRALAKAVVTMLAGNVAEDERIAALEADMRSSPQALVRELARHQDGNEAILLIVDQFEETVSLSVADDREPFSAAIAAALDREQLYLITTMRSDFVPQLPTGAPALGEAYNNRAQRYLLPPMSLLGLREAITRPALKVGVVLEPALVERILNDSDGRTMSERQGLTLRTGVSALALAAHVLRMLWDAGAADDKIVELKEYVEDAGGLEGTLSASGDKVLRELSQGPERDGAKKLLLALVVPSWRGHPVRRVLTRSDAVEIAGGGTIGERVVTVLSGGGSEGSFRILVVDDDSVDLVHEALFTGWKQYSEWIESGWSGIVLEDKVRREALIWQATGCRPVGLSTDIRVDGLLAITPHGSQAELIRRYQSALRAADQRNKQRDDTSRHHMLSKEFITQSSRTRRIGVVTTLAGLLAGALGGWLIARDPVLDPSVADCPETVTDKSQELGLRASRLATIPGKELEALELAVQAVGRPGPGTEPPAAEAVQGLADALTHMRMIRTLRGHGGAVHEAVFSPQGKVLATTGEDGVVRLWDPASTGDPVALGEKGSPITAAVFSPDGTMLVTGSNDGGVKLWSTVSTKMEPPPLQYANKPVTSVLFSHDATAIVSAAAEDPKAQLWIRGDKRRKSIVLTPPEPDAGGVTALAFSPDDSVIVTGDRLGQLRVWTTESGDALVRRPAFSIRAHDAQVTAVAFSPDGKYVASASSDHKVRLLSPDDGQLKENELSTKTKLVALAWAPGTSLLAAAGADGSVHVWDVDSGQHVEFDAHHAPLTDIAFSADGSMLATSSEDHGARLWAPRSGQLLARLEGHQGPVAAVDFSPDGTTVATAGRDGTARLWRVETASPVTVLAAQQGPINGLTLSHDGSRLVTTGNDGQVYLWNADTGRWLESLQGHVDVVTHAVFSPDNSTLVTADAKHVVRLWPADDERRTQLESFDGLDSPLSAIAFAHDSETLATFVAGHVEAQVWSMTNGKQIAELKHDKSVVALAATPVGPLLFATASRDHNIRLWGTSEEPVATSSGHAGDLTALAFSAKGDLLVTASTDRSARLWDTKTGSAVMTFDNPAPVYAATLSHGGSVLATATEAGVYLWNTKSRDRIDAHLGQLGRSPILTFSPDGGKLAAVYADGRACWWEASTGAQIRCSDGEAISLLTFNSDGTVLATASVDGTIRTWNANDGEFVDLYRSPEPEPRALVFSPAGPGVIVASGDSAVSYDTGIKECRKRACESIEANTDIANADAPRVCAAIE